MNDKHRDAAAPAPAAAPSAGPSVAVESRDEIGFTLRVLEPWIGWSIAAYTAACIMLIHPDRWLLWVFVVYALLVGKWADMSPAHRQIQFLFRALAVVAGAFALQFLDDLGTSSDLPFVWTALGTLFYVCILRKKLGWVLIGISLASFIGGWWLHPEGMSWQQNLARAALLYAVAPLLALRLGGAVHWLEDSLEESLRDRATGLYNEPGMLRHGEALVNACRAEKKPVSMVMFDARNLRNVHKSHGRRAAREALAALVNAMHRINGDRNLLGRTGSMEFTVLAPAMSKDKLVRAVEKELGLPPVISYHAGGLTETVHLGLATREVAVDGRMLADLLEEVSNSLNGEQGPLSEPAPTGLDESSLMNNSTEVSELDASGFAQTSILSR